MFWAAQPVLRTVSVAVRVIGRPGAGVHGYMADSGGATNVIPEHLRRSGRCARARGEVCKPSAQPTLVRTKHLPPVSAGQGR
jgi:hypothetical protein